MHILLSFFQINKYIYPEIIEYFYKILFSFSSITLNLTKPRNSYLHKLEKPHNIYSLIAEIWVTFWNFGLIKIFNF